MRKAAFWAAVGVALIGVFGTATFALAHGFRKDVKAQELSGYNETPSTLSTTGSGWFRAKIDDNAQKIEYTLHYEGLEGNVTQAHIHLGRPALTGGIMLWLCGTASNPGPAGTPVCPAGTEGTVSGTLAAAQVVGPTTQGVEVGAFNEAVAAIRAGATYANVHSTKYGGGEIRAPLIKGKHGFGRDK